MEIHIDPHTLERAEERGAAKDEILDVIRDGFDIVAKHGRYGKAKIYSFNNVRNGKFFEQKRIEVIYIIENNLIITVTVYVFYGKWEN